MTKLLIVDDERIIREDLALNLPWRQHGIELVTPAGNGREAVEVIEREKPDIVLADINMPVMDGLELAAWLAENHKEIKIMFLTGYDDFKYAKRALELHVQDYILKYESREKIIEAVKRCELEYHEARKGETLIQKSKSLLQSRFLTQLIMGIAEEQALGEFEKKNRFDICDPMFYLVLLHMDCQDSYLKSEGPNTNEIYAFSAINIFRELAEAELPEKDVSVYFGTYDGQVFAVFAFRKAGYREEFSKLLESVVENLRKFLNMKVKIAVSQEYHRLSQTDDAYNESYRLLELMKLGDSGAVVHCSDGNCRLVKKNAIMEEIEDYIMEQYSVPGLSLNDLANHIHLSPAHLCRIIKKNKNTNFMAWLTSVRIEKAASLMKTTDDRIYEICEKVGYNNPQYFSVIFKKYMGVSPREYMEK